MYLPYEMELANWRFCLSRLSMALLWSMRGSGRGGEERKKGDKVGN